MKTFIVTIMLTATLANAQDVTLTPTTDTPVADIPNQSVRLSAGFPAPFNGRLLSDDEQVKRGKENAALKAELKLYKSDDTIVLTKPAAIAIIGGTAALAAVITGLVVGLAGKIPKQPTPPAN